MPTGQEAFSAYRAQLPGLRTREQVKGQASSPPPCEPALTNPDLLIRLHANASRLEVLLHKLVECRNLFGTQLSAFSHIATMAQNVLMNGLPDTPHTHTKKPKSGSSAGKKRPKARRRARISHASTRKVAKAVRSKAKSPRLSSSVKPSKKWLAKHNQLRRMGGLPELRLK